jgi:hypothetical protein
MAINQNHLFEDLDGVKCAIVEKNADRNRVEFLKPLLEGNGFTVVVVPSPPPKSATPEEIPQASSTFTIGVTDVTFNPTNAIFGRLLRTAEGHVVTLAYWNQEEKIADDTKPYFNK